MRKPKTSDQTEWWVKKQVREILEITGWTTWMPSAGIFGANGVSDFLCIKNPKLFMAIETKYDNVVTAQQYKFLKSVDDAGHYALLVDETNVGELRALLDDLPICLEIDSPFMKWMGQDPAKNLDLRTLK
jgi:hypothetical protein